MRQVLIGGSLVLALTLGAGSTPAEEPEGASPLRLYHVGALTMGRSDFLPRVLGLVRPDMVSDEQHPLFGAAGGEPLLPVGTADEIVELLRYQVDPGSWESVAGAFVRAMGGATLLVRQQPEALVGVGQAIRRMEDRWLRPITLDVVAVRLPPTLGGTPSATELEALATAEASGPSITLTVFPTQRVTAFSGRQIAYLVDYDVEVAQKAKISDPIVGVLNAGLGVSARASVSEAGDRVRVDLNAELVELLRMDSVAAGDGRTLDVPVVGTTVTRTSAELTTGAWTLLEGSGARAEGGGVVFLARARLGSRNAGAPSPGLSLPVLESAGMAKLNDRAFSISLLTQPVHSRMGAPLDIMPSNFTPPEPPELPEPMGAVASESLLEIMRQAIAPEAWGARGGSTEVRSDTLYVRAPETALLAVERMLAALEHALLWAVDIEGRLVEVAADSPVLAGPLLPPEAEAALAKALGDGSALLLERVRVSSLAGQRNNVAALEQRTYVADFEVEIAEDAVISNPVVQILRSGIVLDVRPQITSARDSVVISVGLNRSVPFQTPRLVKTVVGDMQCPDMRLHELRTDVEIPFGRTAVAGAFGAQGGRRTVLLLTPRLTRPAR